MAMNDVSKFLKAVHDDPEVREQLKKQSPPTTDEEAVKVYVDLASSLGYTITTDEIARGLTGAEKYMQGKSDSAAASVKEALDESALEQVAGGGVDPRCSTTFSTGEWCWFDDSCAYIINGYDDNNAQEYADYLKTGPDPFSEDPLEALQYGCDLAAVNDWNNNVVPAKNKQQNNE